LELTQMPFPNIFIGIDSGLVLIFFAFLMTILQSPWVGVISIAVVLFVIFLLRRK